MSAVEEADQQEGSNMYDIIGGNLIPYRVPLRGLSSALFERRKALGATDEDIRRVQQWATDAEPGDSIEKTGHFIVTRTSEKTPSIL